MKNKETNNVNISVKRLIELVLLKGSLSSSGWFSSNRSQQGISSHKKIQKSRPDGYKKEVSLSYTCVNKEITINITGRVDGIFLNTSPIVIEEIKSTNRNLDEIEFNFNHQHCAQARIYAYMYAANHNLEEITVQLTYVNIYNDSIKEISSTFTFSELDIFFKGIIGIYIEWITYRKNWLQTRNESIIPFQFPYETYRNGQYKYAGAVYRAIKTEKHLFAQAPTGTGKTIGTLFPAIKALGSGFVDKIFYLTAKTIGRTVAEKTLIDMREKSLRIKSVTLTAKEKICFQSECNCDPEECEYSEKYFDKISEVLTEVYRFDDFNRKTIEKIALQYRVCPFELSLDISLFVDCIICDYNYVFDPRVCLKRYFENITETYVFLIDESHNLPDRAREMFSADLVKNEIMVLKRKIKKEGVPFLRDLNKLNSYFLKRKREMHEKKVSHLIDEELPSDFITIIKSYIKNSDIWLEKNITADYRADVQNLYFRCHAFIKASDNFDEKYISYCQMEQGSNIRTKLFCIDPSKLLTNALKRSICSILFSATLIPLDYFKRIILNNGECNQIQLPSPFPGTNFGLFIHRSISTKYIHRVGSYEKIADLIINVNQVKPGNYMVYFPSYAYMDKVFDCLNIKDKMSNLKIQKRGMTENEKAEFLKIFSGIRGNNICAFAVMGGIFGEGIDLKGDKLIGVIIVGVGLPQICLERNLIMDFFSKNNENGFSYSYQLPGFNRVLQAAGRVIRSETDRGIALLIDTRFVDYRYTSIFPNEWSRYKIVQTPDELLSGLKEFWKKR